MKRPEQETTIRWSADPAGTTVSLWTAQPLVRRKLERAGYSPARASTQAGAEVGWFFQIPLAEFRWRAGARKRRRITPTQRQAAGQRLQAVRRDRLGS